MKSKDHYTYHHTMRKIGNSRWQVGRQPVKNGQETDVEWLPTLFHTGGEAAEDRDLLNKSLKIDGLLTPGVTVSED